MDLLLVSPREGLWQSMLADFGLRGLGLDWVPTLEQGLVKLRQNPPVALILDAATSDEPGAKEAHIKKIRNDLVEILKIDARVHPVLLSDLPPDELHDALEGFGLLLCLSADPASSELERLSEALQEQGV